MTLRSASREAVAVLGRRRDEILGADASTQLLSTVASELYSVAALLVAQPRLRRVLGDSASAAEGRAELAGNILQGQVGAQTIELVKAAVAQRWSSPWDLTDALERTGDDSLFASAQSQGVLDTVEDELFRFERILGASGELAGLLEDNGASPQRRIALLDSVVADKVHPITRQLLQDAVSSERKRSMLLAIDDLLQVAAARKEQSVARVTTPVELSAEQQSRLAGVLTELYGRPISVRTALDPAIRGGLVVRVGDEVIDGSITTRLLQARSALAG
jgi:F-type H+-transporting ATPase subunit delta